MIDLEFFSRHLPFWHALTPVQQDDLVHHIHTVHYPAGALLHQGSQDCTGLILINTGQLRIFLLSDSGKEITLYRMLEQDVCILSASCIIKNLTFDVHIEAEKDTTAYIIPTALYDTLNKTIPTIQNFTTSLISSRFSDVMWIVEQIVFMKMDARLAQYLLEQSSLENSNTLYTTHEKIAKDLGTAREVVTRLLKYFQNEGIISLERHKIHLIHTLKLQRI